VTATRFWIGVASAVHVARGVAGGFCQLGHGKAAPIRRLSPGDWIIYYSPRTARDGGEPVQAFTVIGRVKSGEPYASDMGGGFVPARRDVAFLDGRRAPIKPLIDGLSFIRNKQSWGYAFHTGLVENTRPDFDVIAAAMGAAAAIPSAG
jgi:hypothetical protein